MIKKKKSLKEILSKFPTIVRICDGSKPMYKGDKPKKQKIFFGCNWEDQPTICIQWSEKGRGFGEYVFYQKDGKLYCRNECDDKATVSRIMLHLVDQAIFTEKPFLQRKIKCKSKLKSNSKSKLQTKK